MRQCLYMHAAGTSTVLGSITEREKFAVLYRENHDRVRAVLYRIAGRGATAEGLDDLVQQTFVKIWRSYAKFRNEASASTWIYRIAVNTALDELRSRERTPESPLKTLAALVDPAPGAERGLTDRDLVEKGLAILSDDHRAAIVLAFWHDLSIAEIAAVIGASEGTVKSRIHYAKQALREYLAKNGVVL